MFEKNFYLNSEKIHGSIVAGVILMNEAPKHLNDGAKNKGNLNNLLIFFINLRNYSNTNREFEKLDRAFLF